MGCILKAIILSLLFFISINAQSLLLFDEYSVKNSELSTYNNSLTTKLTDAQLIRLDNLITMLKDSLSTTDLSTKFDALWIFANQTEEAALKNIIKRSHDGTNNHSTAWVQYQGFTGDAANDYIDLNFNPLTQGIRYLQNSASMGIYSRTNKQSAGFDFGQSTQHRIILRNASDQFASRINTATSLAVSSFTDSRGMFVVSRTASNLTTAYRNGASIGTSSAASATMLSFNFFICATNLSDVAGNFTDRQYSVAFVGLGFTATEVRKITNCIEVYMDALGTGVI